MKKLKNIVFSVMLMLSLVSVIKPVSATGEATIKFDSGVAVTDRELKDPAPFKKDEEVSLMTGFAINYDPTSFKKPTVTNIQLEMGAGSSFYPSTMKRDLKIEDGTSGTQAYFEANAYDVNYYGSGSAFIVTGTITLVPLQGFQCEGSIGTDQAVQCIYKINESFSVDEATGSTTYPKPDKTPYISKYALTVDKIVKNDIFTINIDIVDPAFKLADIVGKKLDEFYAVLQGESFGAADRYGKISNVTADALGYLKYTITFEKLKYLKEGPLNFRVAYTPKLLINQISYTGSQEKDLSLQILEVSDTGGSAGGFKPQILIDSYTGQSGTTAGKPLNFSVTFKNNSTDKAVHNVVIGVDGGETFNMAKGVNKFYIDTIEPNKTTTIELSMVSGKTVTPGSYPISFKGTYEYEGSETGGTIDGQIAIPLKQIDRMNINFVKMSNVYKDQEAEVNYSVLNTGMSTALNANLEISDAEGTVLSSIYLGKIIAGGEAKGTNMYLTFTEEGEKTLTAKLKYEDEDFNSKEITSTFKILINTNNWGGGGNIDIGGGGFEPPISEPVKKNNNWLFIGMGIIVVGGVGFVLYKRKKNKGSVNDEDL